jgi:hypothetical protein
VIAGCSTTNAQASLALRVKAEWMSRTATSSSPTLRALYEETHGAQRGAANAASRFPPDCSVGPYPRPPFRGTPGAQQGRPRGVRRSVRRRVGLRVRPEAPASPSEPLVPRYPSGRAEPMDSRRIAPSLVGGIARTHSPGRRRDYLTLSISNVTDLVSKASCGRSQPHTVSL